MDLKNKKILSYDLISKYRGVLMGAAMISIILFHFVSDCRDSDIHFNGIIKLYYYAIGSSGVDLFLILSGFGIFYSFKKNPEGKKGRFYFKRLIKILVPYLVIAIPGWVWRTMIAGSGNIGEYFLDLSFVTLFTSGKIWFWFILLICLFYIAAPYIFKMTDGPEKDKTVIKRLVIVFIVVTAFNVALNILAPDFYENTDLFFLRIFPFFIGMYFGRVAFKKKPIAKWLIIICCLSVLCLPLRTINNIFMRYELTFFHLAIFLLYIVLLEYVPLEKAKGVVIKVLEWLGRYTLELYLSHVLVRNIFIYYGLNTAYFKYEALMLIISFAIAIGLKKLSQSIILRLDKP